MSNGLAAADLTQARPRSAEASAAVGDRRRAGLDRLWARGRAFLGADLAIMGGAISNAGGFGVIASGSMSPTLLDQEITATKALTARPFGVNLITMHPQLLELIDACVEHRVGHVVLAGGIPTGAAMQRIRAGGARVVCFAPALILAKKLVRMGADAIVIEGSEAGGHIGPVSTAVLAQEVLPHLTEVPVFVACGLGRRDAVASVQLDARFPVIPVRALANPATNRFREIQRQVIDRFNSGELSQKDAQLEIEHFWAGALRRAVIDGDVEAGSLMAGQSVGLVTREQSTADILAELVGQALMAIAGRDQRFTSALAGSAEGQGAGG